tara:strand:+ start:543 stop:1727 length:1185 start_codon:yes stop_codon:yes gene_type:complete
MNDESLKQGKRMLSNKAIKNKLHSHLFDDDNNVQGLENSKNINHKSLEAFTGTMGRTDANTANEQEANYLNNMNTQLNAALSDYGRAKKHLIDETMVFVKSGTTNDNPRTGDVRVMKWSDNKYSVVTDRGIVKPMSEETWNNIKGKHGCPENAEENSQALGNPTQGSLIGNNPKYYVGSSMGNQGCSSKTGINARIMSASDPRLGASEYAGAIRMSEGSGSQFEQQDDLTQPIGTNTKLDLCASRAVDLGRTGYAVYRDGDNVKCAIAPAGKKWNDIWEGRSFASTAVTSDTIATIDSNKYNSVSMLFDGRLAKTDIPQGKNLNVIESYDFKKYEQITSQKEDNVTDPTVASRIQLQSATYGANCNGQENTAATNKAHDEWLAHNIASGACSIQ